MATSAQCASPQYCQCDKIKGKYKKRTKLGKYKEPLNCRNIVFLGTGRGEGHNTMSGLNIHPAC